jgi:NAD(P)-dependent dehydrogenase (short-subunit alcohol dehydrogenase family)
MRPLSERTIAITGATSGLGRKVAGDLAGTGAALLLHGRDRNRLQQTIAEIRSATGNPHLYPFVADLASLTEVERLADSITVSQPRLDVLINNAGIIKTADFLEISEADFDAVLRVNLKGVFLVGQAAARAMVERGRGAIVNMSSANAVVAIPNQVPYVTSKGAVNQLTKVMALALADKGVRVNAIGPGSILTDLLKVVMDDEAARRRILSRTPMGRCGEPAEVAKVALFLASDDASYLTGQCIYPDGGRLALNYTVPVPGT